MKPHLLCLLLAFILLPSPALAQTAATPLPAATTTLVPVRSLTPLDGTQQLQLQLVNCNNFLDCGLAQWLLPKATLIESRQLQFANPSANKITLLHGAIVAAGKLTGYQLDATALQLPPPPQTFAANQITNLPLTIHRTQLPPDQYSGTLYLTLANQPEWLTLPLDLSVRTGPLLPLIVLVWGILLGRLLKYMQERGEPQAKVLQELNQLEYELRSLDPTDQASLAPIVAQARRSTYREQFDTAREKIKLVRDRLDVLANLRTLENQLEQRVEPIADDTVNQAIAGVQSARQALIQGEDSSARAGIQQVSQLLNTAGARGNGASSPAFASVQGVTASLDKLAETATSTLTTQSAAVSHWLQRSLILLSGVSERARAEATFWVVRPLLALVLLGGLSAMGLGSLYVEKGATFGARPFSDYLGLILWGLSADVASRSLSNLAGSTPPKPD